MNKDPQEEANSRNAFLLKTTKYELSKNINKLLFANDKDFILIDLFFVSKKSAISLLILRE